MTFKLNNKVIKNFNPSYIIAEVGANFNGDLDIAKDDSRGKKIWS